MRVLGLLALVVPTLASAAGPPVYLTSERARAVLVRHCGGCHGEQARPKGGLGTIGDLQMLLDRQHIVPGDPDRSPLFERILAGDMPPPGSRTGFAAPDREALRTWIASGAPVPGPALERLDLAERLRHIASDLAAQPARQRRFMRYLTLAHLPARRDLIHRAVGKLVNSLSWHPRITPPAILARGLILRLDLRDYRWTAQKWDRLAARNPYQREEIPSLLQEQTGCEQPVLRADWFLATASRPPFYHDFLALPVTEKVLERQLQVDVAENLADHAAVRAGFNGSGVARANRLIERHDALHGAYWRSYDFSDNTGRQNLFEFPLGPAPGPAGFKHAGGELIFHLPNGLQGYFLSDADGRRIDRAPSDIVTDPNRPDRVVENGLSCIGCHVAGIIPREDQVRAHVRKNAGAFSRDVLDDLLGLYAPPTTLRRLVGEDNARFAQALTRLGIVPTDAEPVQQAVKNYEDVVDRGQAANELDLSVLQWLAVLDGNAELKRTLGPLAAGGTVQRQVFEEAFVRIVRVLPHSKPLEIRQPEVTPVATAQRVTGVRALAWSPDGRTFATGQGDGRVSIHETTSRRKLEIGKHSEDVRAVSYSPDGRQLLSAGGDRIPRLWEVRSGKLLHRLSGHTGTVQAVAFFANGERAVTAGEERCLRVWDLKSGKEHAVVPVASRAIVTLAVHPDGKLALVGTRDRGWLLVNLADGTVTRKLELPGMPLAARFTRTEILVAVELSEPRRPDLYRLDLTGTTLLHRAGPTGFTQAVTFQPDGQALAVIDDTIHVLSVVR